MMISTDYPASWFEAQKGKPVIFTLAGDPRLSCRLMIIKTSYAKLPAITVICDKENVMRGLAAAGGNLEFSIPGNSRVTIDW